VVIGLAVIKVLLEDAGVLRYYELASGGKDIECRIPVCLGVSAQQRLVLVVGAPVHMQEDIVAREEILKGYVGSECAIEDDAGWAPVAAHIHEDVFVLRLGLLLGGLEVLERIARWIEDPMGDVAVEAGVRGGLPRGVAKSQTDGGDGDRSDQNQPVSSGHRGAPFFDCFRFGRDTGFGVLPQARRARMREVTTMLAMAMGRRNFQPKLMSWS